MNIKIVHNRYIIVSIFLSLFCIFASLLIGSIHLSWRDIINLSTDKVTKEILFDLRLPRILNAFTVGAVLGLSGAIMQVLLRNPLADPYVLGISGGAAFGSLLVIVFGLSQIWIMPAGFIGAFLSMVIVFQLSQQGRRWSSTRMLLTGIIIATGFGALISFLLTISPERNLHTMLFWLLGHIGYQHAEVFEIILLSFSIILSIYLSPQLNILLQGELKSQSLGIHYAKIQKQLFLITSLLTACAVSIAGTIGFVGLIIPHSFRLLGIQDHTILLPCSMLGGGCFLLLADDLSRIITLPQEVPIGIITALIGVPLFIWLLIRSDEA